MIEEVKKTIDKNMAKSNKSSELNPLKVSPVNYFIEINVF
jgi:hypothetical protein